MTATPSDIPRASPKQERAQQTYELLLDVAGELLAEVGIDRISTNLICARAGLTPPALYRYFKDKYSVLEALGLRLMERQNAVLEAWIARHAGKGLADLQDNIEELLRDNAAITRAQPGAIWILRALHSSPRLAHVRIDSHRYVTAKLVEAYAPHLPHMSSEDLWLYIRLTVELGFGADEMLYEETGVSADAVFRAAANMMRGGLAS